jgi:hypothetical protein
MEINACRMVMILFKNNQYWPHACCMQEMIILWDFSKKRITRNRFLSMLSLVFTTITPKFTSNTTISENLKFVRYDWYRILSLAFLTRPFKWKRQYLNLTHPYLCIICITSSLLEWQMKLWNTSNCLCMLKNLYHKSRSRRFDKTGEEIVNQNSTRSHRSGRFFTDSISIQQVVSLN